MCLSAALPGTELEEILINTKCVFEVTQVSSGTYSWNFVYKTRTFVLMSLKKDIKTG